jgi:hypothetical protein
MGAQRAQHTEPESSASNQLSIVIPANQWRTANQARFFLYRGLV